MALLTVRTLPDPVLKNRSLPVTALTPDILAFVDDMVETMRHYPHCVGLAAPQVGKNLRIAVVDVSLYPKPQPNHGLLIMINPVITASAGRRAGREGCLSVPDFTGNVNRAETVRIEATNRKGDRYSLETSGFEAVVFQHEIDHLDGMLFLDRVSSLKTDVFRRKSFAAKPSR